MIRFFRSLRKKLLAEGKTGNYLKYAVGEIVLVVIGILIALQVNNLNEKRKLETKISENLYSLSQELKSNQEVLKTNIDRVRKQIVIGLYLIDSLNNNTIPDKQKNIYLLEQVGAMGPLRLRQLTTTSLEEITLSGSYSSIVAPDLKEKLLHYQAQLTNMASTMERFEGYWQNIELPYLTKHFSIMDMLNNRSEEIQNQDLELLKEEIPNFQREGYYFSNQLSAFFNNREFASMNTSRYFDLRAVLRSMIWLDESMDELLKSIE
jgi:hypothetical protein